MDVIERKNAIIAAHRQQKGFLPDDIKQSIEMAM